MKKQEQHEVFPAFSRLQDWEGNLFVQAATGKLVRETKTLASYRSEYFIEPIGVVKGMTVLQFFLIIAP